MRLIIAGALAGAISGTLWAAPTIGAVGVTPTTIVAGTPTQLLVTAPIGDPTLIPSSVNLQQRTSANVLTAILGTLHDDGVNGDAAAGDGIFSLRVTLNIATPGTIVFRVSAAFRGSPVRSPSAGINGTISGPGSGGGGPIISGPVSITITSPANQAYLNISPTTVTGSVAGTATSIVVNDLTTPVNNGLFSVALPLREGPNYITASSGSNTATVLATLDTSPPHVAVTQPPNNFTTTDATITVTGIVNDIVVGTVNDQQAGVTVNGLSANVSNRSFTLSGVPLNLGSNNIQVVARDRVGNSETVSITVTRQALAPSQIRLISGNNQTAAISTQLPAPLVVQLIGANGNPAPNVPVVFRVSNNNGLVGPGAPLLPSIAVSTDGNGKAQVNWTLGARAGSGSNGVEATSTGYDGTAIFIATGTPGGPRNIVVDTGDAQTGAVNSALPRPLIAVVVDGGNNRLANVPVTFTVAAGGGNFASQSAFIVNSDSDGRVSGTLTLGPNGGAGNNVVQATFPGNPASPATFTASGKVPGNASDTTITGVVLDNSGGPISGVTVRAVLSNLLTSNGQIVTTLPSVQTNVQGQFTVVNAPVGYVKVLVDGSTATRPNVTFPTLDYDLVTVAGQVNTVGLPIYLPALSNNRLCVTQTTGGGTLTMVEAPGFALTFAPGQVTFPGGSKSGCVSATLVNSDKMPMVPGFGQQPRFLVTIQPAGALFNPPAVISMPNVDGLPPHAVTEMYSFDHDIGAFVAIGTGTVSADALAITSSPGSGVLKAGWHCGGNPAAAGGAQTVNVTIGTAGPIQLDINATGSASSTGTPSPGTYSWSSSNPAVAVIVGASDSASVSFKGLTNGTAVLTVTYTCDSGASDSKSITVKVGLSISVISTAPTPSLLLGTDGTINYRVAPAGGNYDSVSLEIKNAAGTLVFKQTGLATSSGDHATTWTGIKWNQGANAGAFANPKNGPYEIKIIGTKNGTDDTDTRSASIKLIVEADLTDAAAAGVSRSAGINDVLTALKIVMKQGANETIVTGAGALTLTGTQFAKHVKADAPALNNLADGLYDVEFRDLRDDVGNFGDTDNNAANGIQVYKFQLNLR
ncbi:MAG: choice-of-anchor X domain-containing protein [Candidatus Solibacter sp.]